MKAPAFLLPLLGHHAASCQLVDQAGRVVASRVHGALDATSRKKGLLGRTGLDEGEALVIAPCSAVHTFFMRFPIDVVHLDRAGRVVRLRRGMPPSRIDVSLRGFAVVELAAGSAERLGLRPGDSLRAVATSVPSVFPDTPGEGQ
jgi:uncharacterized protein